MRKRVKEQLTELLNTMLESCDELCNSVEGDKLQLTLLEDCQNAAILVGENIEASEGEGTQAVSCLEKYCEVLYHISEEGVKEEYVAELRSLLHAIVEEVDKFPKTLEVAFFPYKASMWDSLESIWMAANEDPRCHAVVVPIPYVDRNPDGSVKEEHYEINLYPEEVPVVDYRSYPLDEIHPDIAFIHNPYDEKNLVTSVHPNYYSWRLKEHTDCLVYVPYFALPGNLDRNYSDFSAYHHVNYIVTQNPEHRKSFPSELPDEMFLPLGSPKFDSVIRKCRNPKLIPEAWRAKMDRKRVFFYNTSLRCAINEPDDYLKKMGEVFKAFAGRDDVCLVWRPHPLLEATFDSMQPEYAKVFRGLRNLYIKQNIGIYDDTPCMEDTISWCDAYLGDEGSSVISSFSMAQKPIFILNNEIRQVSDTNDWMKEIFRFSFNPDGDDRWIVTLQDELWHAESNDYSYKLKIELRDENSLTSGTQYCRAKEKNGKVYILPDNAQDVLIYDTKTGKTKRIELEKVETEGNSFSGGWFSKGYVWLVPNYYPAIVRIDLKTDTITYLKKERDYLIQQHGKDILAGSMRIEEDYIVLSSPIENKLLYIDEDSLKVSEVSFDMEGWKGTQGTVREYTLTEGMHGREKAVWILPREGYDVIHYDLESKEQKVYHIEPKGFHCLTWPDGEVTDKKAFGNVISYDGERTIFSPLWGNMYVELDLSNGKSKEWKPEITEQPWEESLEEISPTKGGFTGGRSPLTKAGIIRIADYWTRRLFEYNFTQVKTDEHHINFNKQRIAEKTAGFQKGAIYSCREDVFNSLEDIVNNTICGLKFDSSIQAEYCKSINSTFDGKAGENIIHTLIDRQV
jgi:hypothetical protein